MMAIIIGVIAMRKAIGSGEIKLDDNISINGLDLGALVSQLKPEDMAQLADGINLSVMSASIWPFIVLAFVMFFYCLGALFDERNDRSVLFWKSLPLVKNLRTILHNFDDCKKDILEWQPEILILIDYPGFNLRIARWAHEKNIKVVYYITPQVWAWHKSRVHKLGKYTRKLLVILPFQKAFFRQYGYDSTYVGHPLLDAISQFRPDPEFVRNHGPENVYIALLPGSRRQEIKAMLPVMLRAVTERKDLRVLIAGAPSADPSLYKEIMQEENCIENTELIFTGPASEALDVLWRQRAHRQVEQNSRVEAEGVELSLQLLKKVQDRRELL